MFQPRRGIFDEEDSSKEKPRKSGITVVEVGFNPKRGVFDEDKTSQDSSSSGEDDTNQVMDDACVGMCKALNTSPSAASRLRQYLEAFMTAAKMKHESNDSKGGNQIEDSEGE
jgi:hypothetical protein